MKMFSIGFLFFVFSFSIVNAQELRCNVSVNAQQIVGANKNIFETMQITMYEFMNNHKWTSYTFSVDERIECSINIQLTQQISGDEYKGTIQVQSTRPVYGSSYRTTILNIKDENFRCKYQEFQTLEFDENANKDNLTNILAYYAYIILGFDFDTFSPSGGTEFFDKARVIVNNSQNAVEQGWQSYQSDYNRYWLVDNVLNKSYSPYRQLLYQYHRLGLDVMAEKPEEGRSQIAESLKLIQKVFRARTSLYITQLFFDAKSDELVNVFSNSMPDEQNRVYLILSECNPTNASKYESIKKPTSQF